MKNDRKFERAAFFLFLSFLLGSSLFASGAARAQRTAGAVVGTRPVSTRRVAVRPIAVRAQSRRSANAFFFDTGAPNVFQPGLLGFGGSQFISLNNDPIEAVIDPATEWRIAVAERFLNHRQGFGGVGGFYLLDGGGEYVVPEASADSAPQSQQPQVIVVQAAPPAAPQAAAAPAPEPPLPDVGQFSLILRNGTQIQAVAFTHLKDQIVYITADGSRRTIPASDIDSDATVRVNEERGTPLQLPL